MPNHEKKSWVSPLILQKAIPPANTLMVGISADGREVVINHPNIDPDEKGYGHITFSPEQACDLAKLLIVKAYEIKGMKVTGVEAVF